LEFSKKNGYKALSAGFLPAKADAEAQQDFIDGKLKPMINEAKQGKIRLFFVDASHFVMGGFSGHLWSKTRVFVKTACGRSRYNVLGAVNFITKKVTTVTNDRYITAVQVIELMKKILMEYPGEPVKMVLDNAGYQQCKIVKMFALLHGIELVFLPAYSPNLNLIERLWKFVKSEVLNAAYYGSFDIFKNAIDSCISKTGTEHLSRVNSLLSENIQSFCGVRVLGGL
jgi:transposase